MSRNENFRHNKKHNWNSRSENRSESRDYENRNVDSKFDKRNNDKRHFSSTVSQKEIREKENAIRVFKEQVINCELCGKPIDDIANAISNKGSDNPVHFDCVIQKIEKSEKPGINDKVTYIGQGRFALLHFDNPHDNKHFTIKKIIEWEDRDKKRGAWRDEMAGLFSQVK